MKVLIVDDEKNIRESMQRLFELEGIEAVTAADGREGAEFFKEGTCDVAVVDLKMPRMGGQELLEWLRGEGIRTPVIMISALGEISDAVRALKSGAEDYLIKPFDPAELLHKVRMVAEARRREDLIEAGARTAGMEPRFIGESPAAQDLRRLIRRIAATDATVLITGESGTGKELVAREIHAASSRSAEPFVAVNIGAVPEQLVESELFGHEKGAFTGADARRIGLFELAGSGTLFLDEIGEMPLSLQVKLLRVLQERKIRRLGGSRDIPAAARIVSATNRDLEAMVRGGDFREDLYYRINVVRIEVPPLRQRREDIPVLAGYILGRIASRSGTPAKRLAPDAVDALMGYRFQGNIRELENILERANIYAAEAEIIAADLDLRWAGAAAGPGGTDGPGTRDGSDAPASTPDRSSGLGKGESGDATGKLGSREAPGPGQRLSDLEREAIESALERWNGNRTKAAADLGISRRTILNKIKLYGLD